MNDGPSSKPSAQTTVVVVEDNPQVSQMLSSILEAVGYRVVVAASGKEGFNAVRQERPAVVLLDLHLPDAHGTRVIRSVRAEKTTAKVPIIVLTGSEKLTDVTDAVRLGANDYMVKPFSPANLVTKLARYARA